MGTFVGDGIVSGVPGAKLQEDFRQIKVDNESRYFGSLSIY